METVIGVLQSLTFSLPTFVLQLVLFMVLHATLSAVLYGPLIRARNQRDGQIAGRLSEADAAAANARRLQTEYEEQLKALRQELAGQTRDTIEAAEKQGAAQLAEAREKAGKILADSHAAVEAQQQEAKAGLSAQADKLAKQIAQRIIDTTLTDKSKEQALARLGGL